MIRSPVRRLGPLGPWLRRLIGPCHRLMPKAVPSNIDAIRNVSKCVGRCPVGLCAMMARGPEMSSPLHILIVDDDPRIRTMLRRYLTGEGFKVSDAGDGAAMRRVLEGGTVDLVLL